MADSDGERRRRDRGWRDGRDRREADRPVGRGAAVRLGTTGPGGGAEADRLGLEQQRRATAYGRARGQL